MNNIFIEGIMGTGKSELLKILRNEMNGYKVYYEGGLSPVESIWCAYLNNQQYNGICEKYKDIVGEIESFTKDEDDKKIIAYTKILTDIEGFHKDLEQYEIYHGNISFDKFKDIIIKRYKNFEGKGNIFECSFFQYSITTMILFYEMEVAEIVEFYKEIFEVLCAKDFKLIYLKANDILEVINNIRKNRVDNFGNGLWFDPMVRYIENSPYGIKSDVQGLDILIEFLEKRVEIELKVIYEVIGSKALVIEDRNYGIGKVIDWCVEQD